MILLSDVYKQTLHFPTSHYMKLRHIIAVSFWRFADRASQYIYLSN